MQPLEINRCQDVCHLGSDYIEFRKYFDLPPRERRIDVQFSRDGDEILFEHLEGDNARSVRPALRGQIDRAALFARRTFVARVYENIGVEKATSVHGFRRD